MNDAIIPGTYILSQNFPNPFNPVTTISFDVAKMDNISLIVYDLTGKEISRLADGFHVPGRYSVIWDAMDHRGEPVSSGMYIYQYKNNSQIITKKMIFMK